MQMISQSYAIASLAPVSALLIQGHCTLFLGDGITYGVAYINARGGLTSSTPHSLLSNMVARTSSVRQLVTILSTALIIVISTLRTTRVFTYHGEVSAPCESVLALLHDPYHLASQSPVFESIVPDEGSSEDSVPGSEIASDEKQLPQTQWYRVTDRVPVIGSLQTSVTVQMKIAPADDGVETEVQAGFGVSLRTKYTVKSRSGEGEVGECSLTEVATVEDMCDTPTHRTKPSKPCTYDEMWEKARVPNSRQSRPSPAALEELPLRAELPAAVVWALTLALGADVIFTTGDYTYQREIRAPYETVLNIVRDPIVFSSHSPYFKSIEPDTSTEEKDRYIITERLPLLGPIETSTTFHAMLVPIENGLDADVEAALGTVLKSKYTVERGEGGTSVVKELTTVKALTIAFDYVYNNMKVNHVGLWDNIAKELEN
ncbi:hypothetical protein NMY22_g1077 [Coprinellus aureogranulatus]|nr:hypothetical protein NMY22_g1077 [Coprinellus aureogranulatus]